MALTRKSTNRPGPQREIGSFRVIALDPGGTTGWAYAEYYPQANIPRPSHHAFAFGSGQLGPEEHHSQLADLLSSYAFGMHDRDPYTRLQLVCESFEFRQHMDKNKAKMKVELISKEYIGITKLFSQQHIHELTFQTASAAKGLIPDKGPQKDVKIKQLGWETPGAVHAMDATRHLIYYLVRKLKVSDPFTDVWLNN